MVTWQVGLVPVQAPLHSMKTDPAEGSAVRVTTVPTAKLAAQAVPQLIPAGLLVTVPLPLPVLLMVRGKIRVKVAVTVFTASTVTWHTGLGPTHAPLHSVNTDPAAGSAVRVTTVPLVNPAVHVAPQSIPAGLLVTVPVPEPTFSTVRVGRGETLKVAVTDLAASMVTWQVLAVPEHAPVHPANMEPAEGEAVRVTTVPLTKFAEQVLPQLMPAGLDVTVPPPVPAFVTVSAGARAKVAVTDLAASMVTWQVPAVPEQAPLHPVKADPTAAVAVRVTTVPGAKLAEHDVPQSIPSGLLVTLPLPAPAFVNVRVGAVLKVAVTLRAALMVTLQVLPAPVQAPLHPANTEPTAGVAVRVTTVPLAYSAPHAVPQSIPAGLDVTLPLPVPALATLRA